MKGKKRTEITAAIVLITISVHIITEMMGNLLSIYGDYKQHENALFLAAFSNKQQKTWLN